MEKEREGRGERKRGGRSGRGALKWALLTTHAHTVIQNIPTIVF
jgi:hypothetical protein